MALPVIRVTAGTPIHVEVFVGYSHFGKYDLHLWNPEGTENTLLGEGINADDDPDVWPIPFDPEDIDGAILHWRIRIASLLGASDEEFTASVSVLQDGVAVEEEPLTWSGALGNGKQIEGGARLVVDG